MNDLQVILSTGARKEPPSEMENSNATTPPRPKRKRNQDIDIARKIAMVSLYRNVFVI